MTLETCYGPELNIYEETPEHAKTCDNIASIVL